MTISESFKRFQYVNFETDFLENGNLFLEQCFLVGNIKIENASLPYKRSISEANVKKNRMVTTKWTYHKERSFACNYFIFWKFSFSLRTFYKELIWCTNNPNAHICTFCNCWSLIWRWFFPVGILNEWFGRIALNFLLLQFRLNNKYKKTGTKYFPGLSREQKIAILKIPAKNFKATFLRLCAQIFLFVTKS